MADDMSTIPLRGSESTDNTASPPADGETQPGPSLEPVDRNAAEGDHNQSTPSQDQTPSDDIGTDRPSVQQVIDFFKHTDPMSDLGLWPQHIPFQTPLGDSTYNGTGLEYLELVYLSAAQRLGLPLAGFQATRDAWLRHGLTSWSSLIEMDTKNFDDVTDEFHDYYELGHLYHEIQSVKDTFSQARQALIDVYALGCFMHLAVAEHLQQAATPEELTRLPAFSPDGNPRMQAFRTLAETIITSDYGTVLRDPIMKHGITEKTAETIPIRVVPEAPASASSPVPTAAHVPGQPLIATPIHSAPPIEKTAPTAKPPAGAPAPALRYAPVGPTTMRLPDVSFPETPPPGLGTHLDGQWTFNGTGKRCWQAYPQPIALEPWL